MGCLIVLLALLTPRFVIVLLWLFTNYLTRAFDSWLWPTLGFLFLPATTLAYAFAENRYGGVKDLGLVLVIVGLVVDLGLYGGGAKGRRRRR